MNDKSVTQLSPPLWGGLINRYAPKEMALAWALLAVFLGVTAAAWKHSEDDINTSSHARFNPRTQEISAALEDRVGSLKIVIVAGVLPWSPLSPGIDPTPP